MSRKFDDEQQKPIDEAKYSKILNRKQIQKRLEGLTSEEYQKIIINLQLQNGKLREQVKKLDQKVQELVQSRKITKTNNPQLEQDLAKLKKQLELKYESMNYLKQQLQKSAQTNLTEDMKVKIVEHSNIVARSEVEYKQLQAEREKLKMQIQHNEADLAEFLPNSEADSKMESIKVQNRSLKGKINKLKEQMILQEKNSQSTINRIYDLKKEDRKGIVRFTRSITSSLKDLHQASALNSTLQDLEKEIEQLKLQKKDLEKDLITDKIIKESKKTKLQKQIRDSLQNHKQMYKRRVKMINHLNLYQKREEQLKLQLLRQSQLTKIVYQHVQTQTTPKNNAPDYRREWIGKSEGIFFDDSKIIQNRQAVVIKAVTIYKQTDIIVFAKFYYESPNKAKFQSQPPFQKSILKKCEAKKYESKTQAELRGLVVSMHPPSKRVVRIEFKWLDGQETVVGWQQQGSIKFPFDIGANQRPNCMFGSVSLTGKTYALETLGCQIQIIKI